MVNKKNENKSLKNPFLRRYSPNHRFINGAFKSQTLVKEEPVVYGDSITDKESYRLSLASARGSRVNLGTVQQGQYMYQDGRYNAQNDYSFLFKPGLSIVELDYYIKGLEERLKKSDEDLKADIQQQIDELTRQRDLMDESKVMIKEIGSKSESSE